MDAGTNMASPHVCRSGCPDNWQNGGQMAPNLVTKQLLKTADKIEARDLGYIMATGELMHFVLLLN
jgi:hypothetical protein